LNYCKEGGKGKTILGEGNFDRRTMDNEGYSKTGSLSGSDEEG